MLTYRILPVDNALPSELAKGAILRDKEYAWELSAFPKALEIAPALGYACLGGQFWFMLPDNTLYEPFWLEANSNDRTSGDRGRSMRIAHVPKCNQGSRRS